MPGVTAPRRGRFFFALWPDPSTQAALAERGRAWASSVHARSPAAESLHLTLAFLGDLAPEDDTIRRALEAAAGVPFRSFILCVDGAGFFRDKQLGWLGVRRLPVSAREHVAALRAALAAAAVPFDPKPFVPHVTVLRGARRFELPAAAPAIRWPVDSFSLMASWPAGRGRAYQTVAQWMAAD